jgi:hypothetical protein
MSDASTAAVLAHTSCQPALPFRTEHDASNAGHASRLIEWARAASDRCGIPVVIEMATLQDTQIKLRWFRKRMLQFGGAFIHVPRAYQKAA